MTEAHETTPAADCCVVDPRISRHFDNRIAKLTVDGVLPEMVDVSEMLFRLLDDVGGRAPTVLELGCGSGALTVALLESGATRADGVDLSPDMVASARRRADDAGVGDRAFFSVGDGAQVALERHDWVVMDRVICCYPRVDALLANAAAAAGARIAFSVPTSRGWRGLVNRIAWTAENIPVRLGRNACPAFVHDLGRIEATLTRAGFRRRAESRLGLWYAAVWERVP